jgi:putative peptidoglycan lipid II flippase
MLGVFAVSIGTVLLPDLAEYAKSNQWEIFNQRLRSAMNIIALIAIPVTFFAMAQGETLIKLLFRSGTFNDDSVRLTLAAFTFHMPGLYFVAMNRVLAPAFYAQSDTKSPTIAGLISFVVNITLAAVLVSRFKGSGIAFALTIASIFNTAALFYFLKKNPAINLGSALKSTFAYVLKLIAISGFAAAAVLFLSPRLAGLFAGASRIVSYGFPLFINALVFAIIGLSLLALTKDKQLMSLSSLLRRKKLNVKP